MRRMRPQVKVVAVAAAIALVLAGAGAASAGGHHKHRWTLPQTCERVETTVNVEGGRYGIVGELCWRGRAHGKPLQILTSGFMFDHTYWDFPHEPQTYSWVEAATEAGYVTLNYDRLGVGGSDMPGGLPDSLRVANQAEVLHQLIDAARSRQLHHTRFRRVVSVGHSLGSSIALYEAGTYRDVDALVLTGNMRTAQPDFVGVPGHRAADDPKFAGNGMPGQVLTSLPGERGLFFHSPNVDPAVVHVDEGLKQTGVLSEVLTIQTAYRPDAAGKVRVPVLIVVGQNDFLFCDTADGLPCGTAQDILDRQAPMLPNAQCVDAVVVEDAGHALNLHLNAQDTFAAVNGWGTERLGRWGRPGRCGSR